VLLADEPTATLDPETTGSLLAVLDRVRAELGVTVLVATQDMSVVRRICDDVAVLGQGRVVESGRLLDLISDLDSHTSSALLPSVDQANDLPMSYDGVADIVLVGFAAVGALLPEAASRFGVELAILGGGLTRFAEIPVARFRVGLNGRGGDSALAWIAQRGAVVRRVSSIAPRVAA
jgi:D-methionine transport system ATP-binding protein